MADLYFSRATVLPAAAADPRFWQQLSDGYGVHQLVWRWFSARDGDPRTFLYRLETNGQAGVGPVLHTLSAQPPADEDRRFAFTTKHYAPQIAAGDWLEFDVRVSPTRVKSRGPGGTAHGKRVDVVMDAKKAESGLLASDRTPEALLVQRTCTEWLVSREERLGIRVDPASLVASAYRQHRVGHRDKGASIRFSSVDLGGRLQVIDPSKFLGSVREGLGAQKAFGCGLWLLRRPL